MIEVLHISEKVNRESILTNGIVPTKIKNPEHLDYFLKCGLCNDDGTAIYTWESCNRNEKFIRDMVFCRTFIHPRNDLIYNNNDADYIDFSKIETTFLGKDTNILYDVFVGIIDEKEYDAIHVQCCDDWKFNSCFNMPDKYAHDDKKLHILSMPLKVKLIGSVEFYYSEKRNYNIYIRK